MRLFLITAMLVMAFFAQAEVTQEMLEESGESGLVFIPEVHNTASPGGKGPVLLIPDSNADAVGMYDPYDGTYWGDFIVDTSATYPLSTPINAFQVSFEGPVLVSDQIEDCVYAYDASGNFMYVAADETTLNNVRGIDMYNDTLYVTSGDDYVAMYSAPMVYIGNFIEDGTDPFDIMFVDEIESGQALLCDIQGTTDNVRLYDHDGTFNSELFQVSFPEQVQMDVLNPGQYLVAGFSAGSIISFTLDGTILETWAFSSPRAAYRLGNGNLLVTSNAGAQEVDAATGAIVELEYSGSCRFIELAYLPGVSVEESPEMGFTATNVNLAPNPFSQNLSIGFNLPSTSSVRVDVYSIAGRIVRTIEPGSMGTGAHTVFWNGRDDSGDLCEQGVYFVRLTTDHGTSSQRVSLIR